MHKRKIILTSLLIVALVTGWAVYRFFKTPPSDLYNTEFIRVQSGDTGEIWDIDDKGIIKKIVKAALVEKSGLHGSIDVPYTFSLYFFTQDSGYGPLLCYKDLGICRFEGDNMGNYIEPPREFFQWIEMQN